MQIEHEAVPGVFYQHIHLKVRQFSSSLYYPDIMSLAYEFTRISTLYWVQGGLLQHR